ncbi:hypothetical protein GQ53DRAFT_652752 [Thozetella sp. PMI_491]|nr:hypothetical protein GQ53DRAFT_652752 [Thozetella sp. PMI_491]
MEQTFYAAQTQLLHDRLGLGKNAKILLKAHDDFKLGRLDRDGLGRLVRLSSNYRDALLDMIKAAAEIMATKHKEAKYCLGIINSCTEILKIAHERSTMSSIFAFTKLPTELRQKIYKNYLPRNLDSDRLAVVSWPGRKTCACFDYAPHAFLGTSRINMALMTVSKWVRDEFLVYFYRNHIIHFTCGCQLVDLIAQNYLLRSHLARVKVHWNGPRAHEAFAQLAQRKQLYELEIVISRATTSHINARETEMRRYFGPPKLPRLCDALGADELLALRGLQRVTVSHIPARQAVRRTGKRQPPLF